MKPSDTFTNENGTFLFIECAMCWMIGGEEIRALFFHKESGEIKNASRPHSGIDSWTEPHMTTGMKQFVYEGRIIYKVKGI